VPVNDTVLIHRVMRIVLVPQVADEILPSQSEAQMANLCAPPTPAAQVIGRHKICPSLHNLRPGGWVALHALDARIPLALDVAALAADHVA